MASDEAIKHIVTIIKGKRNKFVSIIGGFEISADSAEEAEAKSIQLLSKDPIVNRMMAQTKLEEHKRCCRSCTNSLTSLCARGRELERTADAAAREPRQGESR